MGASSFTKKVTEQFGHEIYQYHNAEDNISLDILPKRGLILDIKLLGKSILNGPTSEEDFEHNASFKSAFLIPFPNRLKDGKYEFKDQAYQFPINEANRQNALHGLILDSDFELVNEIAAGALSVGLQYTYTGDQEYYPFPFVFTVNISIDKFKCEVSMIMQNTGDHEMPFGMGWHPYFTLQQSIDDCGLCIPNCKSIVLDDKLIPTGNKSAYKDFSKCKPIEDTTFDSAFLFEKDADFTSIILENEEHKLRYYQETRDSKFNYLQIYTPEDRMSIAFEPMTCNIDAFNNKNGLVVLAPRKKYKARCGVALTKK